MTIPPRKGVTRLPPPNLFRCIRKNQIFGAARVLNCPSFYARNLGVKRTYMIAAVAQEIGNY
jgi:hypothetical protein